MNAEPSEPVTTALTEPRRPSRRALAIAAILLVATVGLLVASAVQRSGRSHAEEAGHLARILKSGPGQQLAEIGAGDGWLTVELAKRVAPSGKVYSTEIDPKSLDDIRAAVLDAGLENVEVVEAGEASTNLPDACCDAIVMRAVYHHIHDPAAFNRSLGQALRPGGQVAIIDFEPGLTTRLFGRAGGASRGGGHGTNKEALVEEMRTAGFELAERVDDWGGDFYLMVFRKAAADGE